MLILILEDEPLVALTLKDLIEDAGHEVAGPVSALEQAIALSEKRLPDALFTNINLGSAPDGVAATEALLDRGVPSIFVSGSVEEAHAARANAIGLLRKPCDPEKLRVALSILETVLRGGTPGDGPAGFEVFEEGIARYQAQLAPQISERPSAQQ